MPRMENTGGTVSAPFTAPATCRARRWIFIERTALDAQLSSDQIRAIASRVRTRRLSGFAIGELSEDRGQLIGGGLPTRIFYVSQGGYDTHTNQTGRTSVC